MPWIKTWQVLIEYEKITKLFRLINDVQKEANIEFESIREEKNEKWKWNNIILTFLDSNWEKIEITQ